MINLKNKSVVAKSYLPTYLPTYLPSQIGVIAALQRRAA